VGTGAVNAYNNFTGNNILTNNNPERTKNNWSGAFDVGTTLMAAAPFASKSGRGALFGEQAWGRTAQTAGQVWGGAKNLPAQALNGVKNLSVSGIKNGATQALNGAKSWGTQGLGWAKNGATQAFNGAKGWGEKGLGGVKDWGAERLGGMKDWGTSAFRGAKDWWAERLQGVKDWGAQALSNSKGFGDRALNGAKTWGEQASGYTKNLGDRVLNGAKNFGPRASLFGQNMRIRASNFAAQARYQAQLAEYHFQLGVRSMGLGHDPQLVPANGVMPMGLEPPIPPINKPLMSVNETPQPMIQGGNHDGSQVPGTPGKVKDNGLNKSQETNGKEVDPKQKNTAELTPKEKKAFQSTLDKVANIIGANKKLNYSKTHHGRIPEGRVREILREPDAVYASTGQNGRVIYRKDGDVIIVESQGSARGNIETSYGSSGQRGKSGAAIFGGEPTDPGYPVTHDMIVNGEIPTPGGGFVPPARQIQ
jgi:hypothetical protein